MYAFMDPFRDPVTARRWDGPAGRRILHAGVPRPARSPPPGLRPERVPVRLCKGRDVGALWLGEFLSPQFLQKERHKHAHAENKTVGKSQPKLSAEIGTRYVANGGN